MFAGETATDTRDVFLVFTLLIFNESSSERRIDTAWLAVSVDPRHEERIFWNFMEIDDLERGFLGITS